MLDYKGKQSYVTNKNSASLGVEVEQMVKNIIGYHHQTEYNNSIYNYGITPSNKYIPDIFLDDTIIEIKYSFKGDIYAHNINQLNTYEEAFNSTNIKLLLISGSKENLAVQMYDYYDLIYQYNQLSDTIKRNIKDPKTFYRMDKSKLTPIHELTSLQIESIINNTSFQETFKPNKDLGIAIRNSLVG
jgi:hypothetical protein